MRLTMTKRSSGKIFFYTMVLAFFISTAYANAGNAPSFSIGGFGGFASSKSVGGIEDYEGTDWETGGAFGVSIMYRMTHGLMFELLFEQFEMGLKEEGNELGTIIATPLLFKIGYQSLPKNKTGVAFHATIGGGMAWSDLEKGDAIKEFDISNDSALMFTLGAGLDYFITKNIALTLDGLILTGNIESEWDNNNGNKEEFLLLTSNYQGLVGVRFWF